MACESDLGDKPPLANEPHLRELGRHQGEWLHVHSTQESAQEIRHHLRFASTGKSFQATFIELKLISCTGTVLMLLM